LRHSDRTLEKHYIWDDLRVKAMPNRAFRSLSAVENAPCDYLQKLKRDPKRIRSMTYFAFYRFI
jgi:hypothetical protein